MFSFSIFLALLVTGAIAYLYLQGGTENYRPPETAAGSQRVQVLNDLAALSQAVEAYYAKNLKYPQGLDQLQPEFIDKLPLEPGIGKPFPYESDGVGYRVGVSNPETYGFKELFIKNGKIIQN